jgi:hypothetical protein
VAGKLRLNVRDDLIMGKLREIRHLLCLEYLRRGIALLRLVERQRRTRVRFAGQHGRNSLLRIVTGNVADRHERPERVEQVLLEHSA